MWELLLYVLLAYIVLDSVRQTELFFMYKKEK